MWKMSVLWSLTMTGDTTLRMSDTSPAAETMTVPGETTFVPSGYFCVMDKESLPVGTFICNSQQKSDKALTAEYKRASSPSCDLQGHIQLAERETVERPSTSGAHTKLVKASDTERMEPASGLANAACGA